MKNNLSEFNSICKIRYTFVLGDNNSDYIDYMKKGTENKNDNQDLMDYVGERKGSSGLFSYNNSNELDVKDLSKEMKKRSSSNMREFMKIFEQDKFSNITEEQRKQLEKFMKHQLKQASDKKFSINLDACDEDLIKNFKRAILQTSNKLRNEGKFFLIPIISFREEDAKKLKIDNESEMKDLANSFASLASKAYGVDKDNLEMVGAYHEKPELEGLQTRQPHMHLILFDKTNMNRQSTISTDKLNELHTEFEQQVVNKHYVEIKNKYTERKDKSKELQESFVKNIHEENADKLLDIKMRLVKLNNVTGKQTYNYLKSELSSLKDILDKSMEEYDFKFDEKEEKLLKKYNVPFNKKIEEMNMDDFQIKLIDKITDLSEVLIDTEKLTKDIVNTSECKEIFKNWKEIDSLIHELREDGNNVMTSKDEACLKETLINKILTTNKEELLQNIHINPKTKEEFIEAIQFGRFQDYRMTNTAILETVDTLTITAKAIGMPAEAFKSQVYTLLHSSRNKYSRQEINDLISNRYTTDEKKFLTKEEFKRNLKIINYNTNIKAWIPDEKFRGKMYKEKFLKFDTFNSLASKTNTFEEFVKETIAKQEEEKDLLKEKLGIDKDISIFDNIEM